MIKLPHPGNIVTLFELEGTAIHKESDEAKKQIEEQGIQRKYFKISYLGFALNDKIL